MRSITPAFVVLSRCFAFDHACCLPQSAKQDGLRCLAFLFRRGSGSLVARSRIAGAVIRLDWFISGLRVFWRRSRRSTRGCGERSQRRGVSIFLRKPISLAMLSAGRTLGLKCGSRTAAAPKPAPKSRMWKRHCRLSGLSSGAGRAAECALRGGVVLARTHIPAKSASASISAPTHAKPGYTERPDRL